MTLAVARVRPREAPLHCVTQAPSHDTRHPSNTLFSSAPSEESDTYEGSETVATVTVEDGFRRKSRLFVAPAPTRQSDCHGAGPPGRRISVRASASCDGDDFHVRVEVLAGLVRLTWHCCLRSH